MFFLNRHQLTLTLTLLLAIVATARMVPRDIEDRTVYTILAKPVPRFEYVVGKIAGVLLLLAISTLVMAAAFLAVLYMREQAVLQATAKMVQVLRQQPTELGLVTSVSGMLTKQACALWSATPGDKPYAHVDVTEEVRAQSPQCELIADYEGPATVAGYTVLYQGDQPWRAVAVFDLPEAQRTVAFSEAPALLAEMQGEECCGRQFVLSGGQFAVAT